MNKKNQDRRRSFRFDPVYPESLFGTVRDSRAIRFYGVLFYCCKARAFRDKLRRTNRAGCKAHDHAAGFDFHL